jgi:hypothetical protein
MSAMLYVGYVTLGLLALASLGHAAGGFGGFGGGGANDIYGMKFASNLTVKNFKWSSCGSKSDLLTIDKLTVGPNPLHVPGAVNMEFSMTANKDIVSPIDASLKVRLNTLGIGWLDLPCQDNMGSCDYTDICPNIKQSCSPIFKKYGIPCGCPVKKGVYTLPKEQVTVRRTLQIPSFLQSGDIEVKANVKSKGKRVTCINIQFSFETK